MLYLWYLLYTLQVCPKATRALVVRAFLLSVIITDAGSTKARKTKSIFIMATYFGSQMSFLFQLLPLLLLPLLWAEVLFYFYLEQNKDGISLVNRSTTHSHLISGVTSESSTVNSFSGFSLAVTSGSHRSPLMPSSDMISLICVFLSLSRLISCNFCLCTTSNSALNVVFNLCVTSCQELRGSWKVLITPYLLFSQKMKSHCVPTFRRIIWLIICSMVCRLT